MRNGAELVGQKFGRLIVTAQALSDKNGKRRWEVHCICGNDKIVYGSALTRGLTTSCGCWHKQRVALIGKANRIHGQSDPKNKTAEYTAWQGMLQRCYNVNHKDYIKWGGRGIKVCDAWHNSFETFFKDVGPKPGKAFLLDRINNDGNYEPGNVKWSTIKESNMNRRWDNIKRKKSNEV
jgi:hypothetical protein